MTRAQLAPDRTVRSLFVPLRISGVAAPARSRVTEILAAELYAETAEPGLHDRALLVERVRSGEAYPDLTREERAQLYYRLTHRDSRQVPAFSAALQADAEEGIRLTLLSMGRA